MVRDNFKIEKIGNSYHIVDINDSNHTLMICNTYRKALRIIKEYEEILKVVE